MISVYNPCNDNDAREFLNQKVQQWIQNANTLKIKTIVLGDFNCTLDHKHFKILSTIQACGLISTLRQFDITTPTWNRAQSSSQIDDIWIPTHLSNCFLSPIISDANYITDS